MQYKWHSLYNKVVDQVGFVVDACQTLTDCPANAFLTCGEVFVILHNDSSGHLRAFYKHTWPQICRYNRRAGQNRRGRRCGQRGFGQRRFAQSAPTGNAAVHDLDGTNSPGLVTGYPVYAKS